MPSRDRITAVLGFQQYVVVGFKRIHKQQVELTLEPKGCGWSCPRCGQRFLIYYDRAWVKLRDLDMAAHRSVLIVPKYRVNCPDCGVARVPLGIARHHARCTKRFERHLFELARTMPISEVAAEAGVHWETVKAAEIRHILGLLRKRDLDGIEELGFDEVSEKKGHRYLTLATDLKRNRVIWVGPGRSRSTLKSFFRWFGPKRCRALKRFVIDMHDPYEQEIRAQCPWAKIIYDHFHLSKLLHLAIDKLRRRLQSSLPPEDRTFLKNKRYLLLKAKENITTKQRVLLKELLAVNKPLNTAYILKEEFRTIFDEQDSKAARKALRQWKRRVRESRIPELLDFVGMLNRRRYGIMNFFRYRITNGMAEGFNNVVKTIKKVAYGFHDSRYFSLKILRKCGRIEKKPQQP